MDRFSIIDTYTSDLVVLGGDNQACGLDKAREQR
jgi:hypothetical protein